MYELFSAFFPILTSFSLKPLTRNHSYIMVYYVFLIRVCDDHSATWHFYLLKIDTSILFCVLNNELKITIKWYIRFDGYKQKACQKHCFDNLYPITSFVKKDYVVNVVWASNQILPTCVCRVCVLSTTSVKAYQRRERSTFVGIVKGEIERVD